MIMMDKLRQPPELHSSSTFGFAKMETRFTAVPGPCNEAKSETEGEKCSVILSRIGTEEREMFNILTLTG